MNEVRNFNVSSLSKFYIEITRDRLYTDGQKSLSRRSVQSVIAHTLRSYLTILGPILPILCEEAWTYAKNLAGFEKCDSVFHLSWSSDLPRCTDQSMDEMADLIKLREAVLKLLDQARDDNLIGSSLAAGVSLVTLAESPLNYYQDELAAFFVTSEAVLCREPVDIEGWRYDGELKLNGNTVIITVRAATAEKCPRCWKYTRHGDRHLCDRCDRVVKH